MWEELGAGREVREQSCRGKKERQMGPCELGEEEDSELGEEEDYELGVEGGYGKVEEGDSYCEKEEAEAEDHVKEEEEVCELGGVEEGPELVAMNGLEEEEAECSREVEDLS